MSFEPTRATHVVFAPPRIIDGHVFRGVVATDIAVSIPEQMSRDLWTVLLMLHGPTVPSLHPDIDLYLTSATFASASPHPQLHLTARNLVDEKVFRPLNLPRQYDVIFNVTWMSFKRHELLVDALVYSRNQGRPLRCMWFGYHWCPGWLEREHELRRIVTKQELDVDFLQTEFDAKEINRRYNRCRSALICSTAEAGPRVMGEALLADIPYITTRDTYGGSVELVDPECGTVCDPAGEDIARAIWHACDYPQSFSPRQWALKNLCVSASMKSLAAALQDLELQKGWRINTSELAFPGFDWQGRSETVKQAEQRLRSQSH